MGEDDLIPRLLARAHDEAGEDGHPDWLLMFAVQSLKDRDAEIERLRAENERLHKQTQCPYVHESYATADGTREARQGTVQTGAQHDPNVPQE